MSPVSAIPVGTLQVPLFPIYIRLTTYLVSLQLIPADFEALFERELLEAAHTVNIEHAQDNNNNNI